MCLRLEIRECISRDDGPMDETHSRSRMRRSPLPIRFWLGVSLAVPPRTGYRSIGKLEDYEALRLACAFHCFHFASARQEFPSVAITRLR